MILRVRWHQFASLTCSLILSLGATGRCVDEPFPERPAGFVADQAGVLLPERAEVLNQFLMAGARERGISVYLLTVRSLLVPPSQKKSRLSELGHRYADRWMKDSVGMVMLFEDETGDSVVVASKETDRQFPPLQRKMALTDPLRRIQHGEGLTRDKIEGTVTTLFTTLSQLQDQAKANARRNRIVNIAMGGIALIGVALLLRGTFRKQRAVPPAKTAG